MAKNLATDTATIESNWLLLIQLQTGFWWENRTVNEGVLPEVGFWQGL